MSGQTQCTATITNLSSTLVNWQAGGVAGGNSTFGTIDTNGLYTAPQTVPSANIVTITAIAQAQTSLTATASVTIKAATAISAIDCSGSTTTSGLTVTSGMALACTATDSGGNPISVFWEVNTITGGNATIGKISTLGNYVAPLIPPAGGTVTITAVSQAVSTETKSVTVNVVFGNRVLNGSYAFSTSGKFTAGGPFVRAGSFTADGNGRLSFGIEDINPPGGTAVISFTGLYSIDPDGRGTLQFCEHTTVNCTSGASNVNSRIVVLSPQQARIIQFETGATASGQIVSQDIQVFNSRGLSGTYTFNFSGISSGTTVESAVGEFFADGDPGQTGNGKIKSGELDINSAGTTLSPQLQILGTSFYSVGANGRGSATLFTTGPTLIFSFYMVSAAHVMFIEQDSTPVLAGDAFKQQFGGPWGASTLTGSIVLGTAGAGPTSGNADLVSCMAAANGATNGTLTAASIDENSGGTVTSSSSLGGTFAFDISGNGRGTLSIPGHSYVFYMIAPAPNAAAVVQEITAGIVAHGSLIQPQGGPFTGATLRGSYAFDLSGLVGAGEEDVVGQLAADGDPNNTGTGKITSGTLDLNDFGTLQMAQANAGTYSASVSANGRTTMSLTPTGGTPHGFVLYFVSPTSILVLGTDSTGPTTGEIVKQF